MQRGCAKFHRQAEALASAWRKYGGPILLLKVPGTNHFTILEQLAKDGLPPERAVELLG